MGYYSNSLVANGLYNSQKIIWRPELKMYLVPAILPKYSCWSLNSEGLDSGGGGALLYVGRYQLYVNMSIFQIVNKTPFFHFLERILHY